MIKSAMSEVETPLMKQYNDIKGKYPDALLLFRVGDFYETFGEDAKKAASILGIVLTRRANGSASFVELAGFPHHALDTYLPKLVRAGQRVAICDQLEDPKFAKKVVKRGVTEVVTPGISYSDKILEHNKNNFLCSIHFTNGIHGIAFIDVSTGEFLVSQGNNEHLDKLLQSFNPSEIIFQKNFRKSFSENYGSRYHIYCLDDWAFRPEFGKETLQKHFGTVSLKGFGIDEMEAAVTAAGAVLHYVSETRNEQLKHIQGISRIEEEKYIWLDKFTIRNLELVSSANEKAMTLLDVLDHTLTSMGGRMMRRWLLLPLNDVNAINERLDAVGYLLQNSNVADRIRQLLRQAGDPERLISRAALNRITPREVLYLKNTLDLAVPLKELCLQSDNIFIKTLGDKLNPCPVIREKINKELKPDAPPLVSKGNVICEGVSKELDGLRAIAYHGKDFLLKIQQREAARTGIGSLKVAFNNVFGYYIEVTHTHREKVPSDWIRKQTLVNAERYITPELKEYEEKILGAEEKILSLETKLFQELVTALSEYIHPIQANAMVMAQLDCLQSFSSAAANNGYVRPQISDSKTLSIKGGRHAVIEKNLPAGEKYIANDVYLDCDTQQIMMITGPNMSGKSALLRQTALIILMAQSGSFVPASSAEIGIVDKIFSRVGASDNISSGESTFMVEMNETASILHNLSDRCLILLDEIGRGTSTYDGISIAWAVAEYLHNHPQYKAKTLFATHYHELNELAESLPRVKNYHVSVKEIGNHVLFLRKLEPGGTEHSFGIHVARMAGIPASVVYRANEILTQLEKTREKSGEGKKRLADTSEGMQLSFFQLDDPVLEQIREEIKNTDINNLTPVEALNKLNEIKKLTGG